MAGVVVEPASSVNEKTLNGEIIRCPRCPSIIFRKSTAYLTSDEFSLPIIARKSDLVAHGDSFPRHTETDFWTVNEMTDFENVGFCHAVEGGIKYLICADCEIGPLGYHDTKSVAAGAPRFHIAVARVRTGDAPPLAGVLKALEAPPVTDAAPS